MTDVFLSIDWNVITQTKLEKGILGGSEIFFNNLEKWLLDYGHSVCKSKDPGNKEYDVAIFSNVANDFVKARKKIGWAGSWHTDASTYPYDEVVNVSDYMKSFTNRGVVIPAPFSNDILQHTRGKRRENFVSNRIVCNANPNKYYEHMLKVCDILDQMSILYHFVFCGGNKLYSSNFPECFSLKPHQKMYYRGILSRIDMINMLSSGHVYALPAFTAKSPTLEVAPIEAMALGIPTILPDVEPYRSCQKDAILCQNEEEFANAILQGFRLETVEYNVDQYREEVIFPKFISLIEEVMNR